MGEIAKIEQPKSMMVPIKALTDDVWSVQLAYLSVRLEGLLSIKDDGENGKAEKRLLVMLGQIKETARHLSAEHIIDAFNMYVKGNLTYNGVLLEPISNYLDLILFNKVINAYSEYLEANNKKPENPIREICIKSFTDWKKDASKITKHCQVFDHLYEIGALPNRSESKKVEKAYLTKRKAAQGYLVAPLFDKMKWMKDEELDDTPKAKEVRNKINEYQNLGHVDILSKFKFLVVEGCFKKLDKQNRNLSDII